MNETRQQKKKCRLERQLAPHVDLHWAEDFLAELGARGVSGENSGAALAEIDSHCAESGESVQEAFGPAKEYAASLDLPRGSQQSSRNLAKVVTPILGQLLGMMLMIWAAPGLGAGQPAGISLGMVVILACVAIFVVIINWQAHAVTMFVSRRPRLSFGLFMVLLGLQVLSAFLLQETVAEFPALLLLITGAAVLFVSTVSSYVNSRNSGHTDDVLTTPLEDPEEASRRRRTLRRADYTVIFMMPVLAVALTAVLAISSAIL